MPPTSRPATAPDRRRHPTRVSAWELRAAVTEEAYDYMNDQAQQLGRSKSWHVGLVVEAFATTQRHMSELERARLDTLLRQPEELLKVLRAGIKAADEER